MENKKFRRIDYGSLHGPESKVPQSSKSIANGGFLQAHRKRISGLKKEPYVDPFAYGRVLTERLLEHRQYEAAKRKCNS